MAKPNQAERGSETDAERTPPEDPGRCPDRFAARTDRPKEVRDDPEASDADIQGDLDMALLQMSAETLIRIDEALVRLDAGEYGSCFECAGEIAQRRLRALPFAVRCLACEERREKHGRARQIAERRNGFSLFPDVAGS